MSSIRKRYIADIDISAETGVVTERRFMVDGRLHADGFPAHEKFDESTGKRTLQVYCQNGHMSRSCNRPALTEYYPSTGQKLREEYWVDDKLHRTDGPAAIDWYENGEVRYVGYYLEHEEVEPFGPELGATDFDPAP